MQGRSNADRIDRVSGSVCLDLEARKGKGRKCWVKGKMKKKNQCGLGKNIGIILELNKGKVN
jgi:hypothetical protein